MRQEEAHYVGGGFPSLDNYEKDWRIYSDSWEDVDETDQKTHGL